MEAVMANVIASMRRYRMDANKHTVLGILRVPDSIQNREILHFFHQNIMECVVYTTLIHCDSSKLR